MTAFITNVLISPVVKTDAPRADEDWKRGPCLLDGCISKLPVPTAREHSPDMQNERAFIQDGYTAMPGPVRKASKFKDLKCHQIVAIVTLPSGLQASEYYHSLRQHTPYLDRWNFYKTSLYTLSKYFPLVWFIICHNSNLASHLNKS